MNSSENRQLGNKMGLTITQEEFSASMKKFIDKSKSLYDGWEIAELQDVKYIKLLKQIVVKTNLIHSGKNDKDIDCSETLSHNSPNENDIVSELTNITLEYNIIYSVSYCVPVLYLRGFDSFGSVLRIDQLIKCGLFEEKQNLDKQCAAKTEDDLDISNGFVRPDTFSQVSHPLNFEPFYQLHPCHTSEWMKMMCSVKNQNISSDFPLLIENYIITWLSFVGPFIGLSLDNRYILP